MRRSNYRKTRIFAEQELHNYLKNKKQSTLSSIESEDEDYLLNINEDDYIQYKVSEAKIDILEIYEDDIYVSSSEQMIPAEYFPRTFNVYDGKSYKKDVIKFHIPFSGDQNLLSCIPNPRVLWSITVEVLDNEFCFEIINFNDDPESIKRDKDSKIKFINQQLTNVNTEVERYNINLETQVKQAFESRKNKIKAKSGVLASLGVPIKKTSTTASTFSIPASTKRKKVAISKPLVQENGFTPEPCLDESIYLDILQMIHDVGKEFERLPSLYAGKEEEHLRDHFLMMLEPNFEGSATGETFNKNGKTDILLRHEGNNVFIGECKFWRGQKSFLNTITQLLGYLTWRDSKASVIMFVPNQDFSSVINIAKTCINKHSNFLKFTTEKDETWFNYEFHLNGDRNRIVKIAVMLYHTPRL